MPSDRSEERPMNADVSKIADAILGIERSVNELWNKGDCEGYLGTYSEDITYFDPVTAKVLVGREAVVADDKGGEKVLVTWNCTEVYRLIGGDWRIVHSHWSFAQHPAIMQNVSV